jgi:2-octaprenylphenol hydroxylase
VSREFDVVIAGAGVVGAAMACLLAARGRGAPARVALLAEHLPDDGAGQADWDLRVFALGAASRRLLSHCGVWEGLPRDRVFAYERMRVWDASGTAQGMGSLCFDCAEIGEPNLGSIVEGRALQSECLQAARAAGVILIESGITSAAIGAADVCVGLADGRELRCQLILGADGVLSRTRELLEIESAGHCYHQDALVAHVRTAKAHQRTAWQRFLGTGPLAFLPLPDGRSSIVWSTAKADAVRLAALDPGAFGAELTEASSGVLGECELTTPIARFPLRLQYASRYVRARAALLGDAAHVVHPLAGQGMNLGLLDCAALADVLGEAAGAGSLGDLRPLRRYERWRKSENLIAAAGMDGLERLFSNSSAAVTSLRAAGLGAVARLPMIKREFARRALGLAGDVPAFLRSADPASPHR